MNVSVERFGESAAVLWVADAPASWALDVQARLWQVAARARAWSGVVDAVCGDGNLTVFVDPDADFSALERRLRSAWESAGGARSRASRRIEVPVTYGGAFGPDLGEVARRCGLREDEVIALHASREYVASFVGFLPGFAYLAGLDARLAVPRRSEPRSAVEAGSVAIAGAMTGVYPVRSPGGWNVIGRTPTAMFDALRVPPALVAPGDRVVFVPVVRDAP